MKYIRTIEEPNKIHEVAWISCGFIGFLDEKNGCDQSHIYRQADTIEELCDEFVWVNHKTNTRAFEGQPLEQVKEYYLQQCDKELWDFYGAIWTDKGLIYVAKMNDKGELELL